MIDRSATILSHGRRTRHCVVLAMLALWLGGVAAKPVETPAPSPEPARFEPLPAEANAPGCGCTFYALPRKRGKAPLVRSRNHADRVSALAKVDGEVRQFSLAQEKHLPEERSQPRWGDRLVLIFVEDRYRIDIASTVIRACRPGAPSCSSVGYDSALILRRGTEAPQVVRGWGECGC